MKPFPRLPKCWIWWLPGACEEGHLRHTTATAAGAAVSGASTLPQPRRQGIRRVLAQEAAEKQASAASWRSITRLWRLRTRASHRQPLNQSSPHPASGTSPDPAGSGTLRVTNPPGSPPTGRAPTGVPHRPLAKHSKLGRAALRLQAKKAPEIGGFLERP